MNIWLVLAFLFCIGSILGWVLELLYRNLTDKGINWVNPGFCTGPYLPIYGFGLCALFLLADLENYNFIANPVLNKFVLFVVMALGMTLIEYVAGIFCLKYLKVRLWDYSNFRGNIQGIICPLFSFFWAILGAVYYFLIHPHILDALTWLSNNLGFSFFIGMFYGVFIIDVIHSAQLVVKLKKFAEENDVVLKYEAIKDRIRDTYQNVSEKYHFFSPFRSLKPLNEYLKEIAESFEHIGK